MATEKEKDEVLLGLYGPIFLVRQHGEDIGVELSESGSFFYYDPMFKAADELVREGLLKKGVRNGTPRVLYPFTERGKIAHWAIYTAWDNHRRGVA